MRRSRRGAARTAPAFRLLAVLLATAVVPAASCGGAADRTRPHDPVPATTTTADPDVLRAAVAAWQAEARRLAARADAATDLDALFEHLDEERLVALSDPAAAEAQFGIDGLLDGLRLDGPAPRAPSTAVAGPGGVVTVAFVNGALDTATDALHAAYRLASVLGAPVRLYYHRSARTAHDYTAVVCLRTRAKLVASSVPARALERAARTACAAGGPEVQDRTFAQLVEARREPVDRDGERVGDALDRDSRADLESGGILVLVGHGAGATVVGAVVARLEQWWAATAPRACPIPAVALALGVTASPGDGRVAVEHLATGLAARSAAERAVRREFHAVRAAAVAASRRCDPAVINRPR
jgi:hypothetical protein